MNTQLGIGIIGTGMVAQYHAQAIAQTSDTRLVAVCRSDSAKASDAERRFGVPCAPSLDALLARRDLNAVCICTPSGMHTAQAIAAAQAGKHVLVEKPIALRLADADAMIAACAQHNVLLGVALQRRTDPQFQGVYAAIRTGQLGRMLLGSVSIPYLRPQSYYDSAAWRGTWALDGGGALMNQGIHLVDLLLWLMGDVSEVRAQFDTLTRSIEVEDCVAATVRFTSGALGSITATTGTAPGFPHRIEVYGTEGGVQIEGEQIVRWDQVDGNRLAKTADVTTEPIAAGAGASPTGISAIGHTRIMQDFIAAIQSGGAPVVSGSEARRSLAVVLAIYESARSGQAVAL
jgi:UDP-N-acetyl-2-amino-2-deoxyglucuronate dehydrogenase